MKKYFLAKYLWYHRLVNYYLITCLVLILCSHKMFNANSNSTKYYLITKCSFQHFKGKL